MITRNSHRWTPTGEADMVELQDLVSGRAVQLVRPAEDELPGEFLADTEELVFRWANLGTHAQAEAELNSLDCTATLHALSWMCALWAVVCETRLGKSAGDILRDLDYRGGWRKIRTEEEAHLWNGLTQRVRLGALAALTEDPRAVESYYRACGDPPDIGPTLVRHTLIHLDAFSQDMERHDLRAQGLALAVVSHTDPLPGPRRRLCFRPSHPL
ncbi:hypothetical protein [Nocardia blacklockiae]|uniref:hypothetical protein n=1 Tax=Nocardia blacklockiae TaxID=480036 RepID=UPI0018961FD9|nr:hypothetical protein [Nocardia blacklockiae]MBF6173372.1 hypothetical protein [Nocardia blacklockiae]